jgi:integrase
MQSPSGSPDAVGVVASQMTKYIIHTALFTSGERFPALLHADTYQPVVLPTRYIIDERRETKQPGTIVRDVRVLGWFYEWCDQCGIDLEARLRQGEMLTVGEISGFCRYLRARRNTTLIGSIGSSSREQCDVLSPVSFNSYLGVIEDFLVWAAYEFIPAATPVGEVRDSVETAKERIRRAFRSNKLGGRSAEQRYGLSPDEVEALRLVIKPGAAQNPFKRPLQFRNYLIIELMLATGIRRGELLKIKLPHLPQGPKTTLTIEHSPDDASDPRRNEPHVKTREREIPLPKLLAMELWSYVQQHRQRGNHSYLFTSQRGGAPLDAASVNWIFDLLVKRCFPHLKGKLHPHVLRHTFNQRLMEQAQALGWGDDQRHKVQTYLNGWSEGSRMPEVYTRRLIETQAMELAERYQAALYEHQEAHDQSR